MRTTTLFASGDTLKEPVPVLRPNLNAILLVPVSTRPTTIARKAIGNELAQAGPSASMLLTMLYASEAPLRGASWPLSAGAATSKASDARE